ncbi:MAG: hypothetical protein HY852_07695 [Bradyrhizobium sp.]|uniref:hypothetical protein n=1 Tax=Bradyrhizobium sp. TaxID=376 RepID=UPI0025BCEFA5|nr:hypothetical protein [Bradyrhizobium sp.]MBI5261686.1 hypothetical protein [Bradyrhizobium sp.]
MRRWRGSKVQTLLFTDVVEAETGILIRDHVWMRVGKWWQTGGRNMRGVSVEFDVTIEPVDKGYRGRRADVSSDLRIDPLGFRRPARLTIQEAAR